MAQTMHVDIEQIGAATSQGIARSHTVFIDRPVAKGGEDRGPLGGEYQLLALGGCFMSNLLAAIRARQADISAVRITVSGTVDGNPQRFTAMHMKVTAKHSDADLVRKLIGIAEHGCTVSNTLRTSLDLSISFEDS